jgi:GTP-binding protein
MTNMDNEDGVRRLQRRMEGLGVFRKLALAGAKEGDTVRIRGVEFDYVDEDADDEDEEQDGPDDEEQP